MATKGAARRRTGSCSRRARRDGGLCGRSNPLLDPRGVEAPADSEHGTDRQAPSASTVLPVTVVDTPPQPEDDRDDELGYQRN